MSEGCLTIIFFVTLGAIIIGVSSIGANIQCNETGKALSYKTEWHYWSGCVVTKPDGSKVLLKQMRDMEK